MPASDQVSVSMTKTEALALIKIAETGLKIVEALNLIPNTTAAEKGLDLLRRAAQPTGR